MEENKREQMGGTTVQDKAKRVHDQNEKTKEALWEREKRRLKDQKKLMLLILVPLGLILFLNFLLPIKGTPLEGREKLTQEEILRIVAIFRYLNPTAFIRIAAGRNYFEQGGGILFRAGANAALTGDMLTTVGNNIAQDRDMLNGMEFQLKEKIEAAF